MDYTRRTVMLGAAALVPAVRLVGGEASAKVSSALAAGQIAPPRGLVASEHWANGSPALIPDQHTSRPGLAVLGDTIWMIYAGAGASATGQFYATSSVDGLNWTNARPLNGLHGYVPSLAMFGGRMWMVYTDGPIGMSGVRPSNILVTCSSNGWDWERPQVLDQSTNIPALASFAGRLWLAYSDAHSSDIWVSSSKNGWSWENTHQVGQNTSVAGLAVFRSRLWMMYKDARGGDFYISSSFDGDNWQDTHTIGLSTSTGPDDDAVPALAQIKGKETLFAAFTQRKQSDIYMSYSKSGQDWAAPFALGPKFQSTSPAMIAKGDMLCMTFTEAHSSQLWSATSTDGARWNWCCTS